MCVCYVNIKGGQVYPAPLLCCLVRRSGIPVACTPPCGGPCAVVGPCDFVFIASFVPMFSPASWVGWGGCVLGVRVLTCIYVGTYIY